MKAPLKNLLCLGVAVTALLWSHSAKADSITFTDVVNTPEEWSFNFSGNGFQLPLPAPLSGFWYLVVEPLLRSRGLLSGVWRLPTYRMVRISAYP
jgi:hypothetical protein